MSEHREKTEKSKQKLREFTDAERDWMERSLTVMPPRLAARAFLDTHWEIMQDTDLEYEDVLERVYNSFKKARYDKTRLSFAKIQEQKIELQHIFKRYADIYPLINPFERLNQLETLRQRDDLTPTQILKLMAIFEKVYESIYTAETEAEIHTEGKNPFDIPMAEDPEETN